MVLECRCELFLQSRESWGEASLLHKAHGACVVWAMCLVCVVCMYVVWLYVCAPALPRHPSRREDSLSQQPLAGPLCRKFSL